MYYLPPVAFVAPATVGSTVRLPGRRRRTAATCCRQRVPSSPAGPCAVVNARGTDGGHVTSAARRRHRRRDHTAVVYGRASARRVRPCTAHGEGATKRRKTITKVY